jgi:hypothetical protein
MRVDTVNGSLSKFIGGRVAGATEIGTGNWDFVPKLGLFPGVNSFTQISGCGAGLRLLVWSPCQWPAPGRTPWISSSRTRTVMIGSLPSSIPPPLGSPRRLRKRWCSSQICKRASKCWILGPGRESWPSPPRCASVPTARCSASIFPSRCCSQSAGMRARRV